MTKPLPERVAGEIRAELARRQMTQAALAAAIGKTEMYLSRRIGGSEVRPPLALDMADLELISDALDVPVSHFLVEPPNRVGAA
jgi:transcriptional regulator with XRE-family HTH domain